MSSSNMIVDPDLQPFLEDEGHLFRGIGVQVLGLDGSTSRRLKGARIYRVLELCYCSEDDLLHVRGIGRARLEEIRRKLNSYLTGVVHTGISVAGHEGNALKLDTIDIGELGLRPKTLAILIKDGVHTIQDLRQCIYDDLPMQYEIEKKLNLYLISQGIADDLSTDSVDFQQFVELAGHLCGAFQKQGLLDCLSLPYRIRPYLHTPTGGDVETLADLEQLLRMDDFAPPCINWAGQQHSRRRALKKVMDWLRDALTCRSIDDEVNRLLGGFDERERAILEHRVFPGGQRTLQEIGDQYGVTRERIRQLERRVRKRLRSQIRDSSLFYSRAAVALLNQMGDGTTLDGWRQSLVGNGLLRDGSSLRTLVAVCTSTGREQLALPKYFEETLLGVRSPRILSATPRVIRQARKTCRKCGAVRTVSLVNEEISEADVKLILESRGFAEAAHGWWIQEASSRSGRANVLERVAAKVIVCCGPISPILLRRALRKHLMRQRLSAPPSEVLIRLLEETGSFALANGLVHLVKVPKSKPKLNSREVAFLRIVRAQGPILTYEEIHAAITAEGYSGVSASSLQTYSPLVEKVEFGLYRLLGARFDAYDLEQAKGRLTRVPANARLKPRSDGFVEYDVNVNNLMVYGGVLSSGPASSMAGSWTIIADGIRQGELAVGKGFIRGLKQTLESLGIAPGDRIRIEFNTWDREATIRKVVTNEPAP